MTGVRRALVQWAAPLRHVMLRPGMTPGFLVVGTKRGGSTSCYRWIAQHPQVAPCRTGKGTHYFDVNHGRGEAWFRAGFPRAQGDWRITGEGSPYYMFHPLAPRRIAETLPGVRLVAVLRDPVERAWSHHRYETARGHEDLPFAEAIRIEEERLAGERERMIAEPGYDSHLYRYHAYKGRGRYVEQLDSLVEALSREQLLILRSEEMFADPHGQLDRVWDFLGLDRVRLDGLEPHKQGQPSQAAMDGEDRAYLQDYFGPLNARLLARYAVDVTAPIVAPTQDDSSSSAATPPSGPTSRATETCTEPPRGTDDQG